jgi:hypothetical protein
MGIGAPSPGVKRRGLEAEHAAPTSAEVKQILIYICTHVVSKAETNFSFTQSFQPHYGPEVDKTSNRNEYQESSWGQTAPGLKADILTAICEPIA